MSQPVSPAVSPTLGRGELWAALLIAGVVLFLNLFTAERSPTVWLDEVSYADPAVNLLAGNGFTSSAWYGQTKDAFWAGNVPLHSFCLAGWMKVWGFGLVQVRSLNYVFAVLAALLVWRATFTAGWLRTATARLCLLGLLLSGFGLCHAYRSGRPDALLVLIAAALIHTFAVWRGAPRLAGLFLGAFLVPWAGLQGLLLLAVAGLFLLFWFGRAVWVDVTALGLGSFAGLVALLFLYESQGVRQSFLDSIFPHTALSGGSSVTLLLWEKLRTSSVLLTDLSLVVLVAGATGAVVLMAFRGRLPSQAVKVLWRGLTFAVAASFAVFALGKFPLFYSWMAYVPAALAYAFILDAATPSSPPNARRLLLLSAAVAMVIGLPLRLGFIAVGWERRDYAPVRELVQKNLHTEDCAYISFQVYYAAKPLVRETFVTSYARAITEVEKARVTCLVIAPSDFAETARLLGGRWRDTGAAVSPTERDTAGSRPYDLRVWRREP